MQDRQITTRLCYGLISPHKSANKFENLTQCMEQRLNIAYTVVIIYQPFNVG
jgi:hypothetical protein